jgi:hypothetical protein
MSHVNILNMPAGLAPGLPRATSDQNSQIFRARALLNRPVTVNLSLLGSQIPSQKEGLFQPVRTGPKLKVGYFLKEFFFSKPYLVKE